MIKNDSDSHLTSDELFPSGGSFLRMMFDKSDVGGDNSGKAWINRTLEQNPVPAVWISNQISHIDPAYTPSTSIYQQGRKLPQT